MTEVSFVWEFMPSGDACGACTSKAGNYVERPKRPHENCKCTIRKIPWKCSLESSRQERTPLGSHENPIAHVTPGGSTTVAYSENSSTSSSGSVGIEGGVVSGEVEETVSEGSVSTTSRTFAHDPNISEGTQVIVEIFRDYLITRFETWDCGIAGTLHQFYEQTESIFVGMDQRPAS